jgi:AraC-like DNA-binding protein
LKGKPLHLEIYVPQNSLRTFVKSIIYYQGYNAPGAYEKLLPDGNAQLIIALDDSSRVLPQAGLAFQKAWVTGVQTRPLVYEAEQEASTVCIQLQPDGLFMLTGIPAIEFQNTVVEATAVWGTAITQLREKLLHTQHCQEIVPLISSFLATQATRRTNLQGFLPYIDQQLGAGQPLSEISRTVGYSHKQLIHIFKKQFGLSPKKYQRLSRFNKALSMLATSHPPADVVSACHFYDQAHYIKEFKFFTGYTPTAYLNYPRSYPHVMPLNTLA